MSTVEVDSYRAWGVVVGGFIANFILGGLAKSYGIIMEAYQEEFDSPTVYFTLTGGVLYMIMFIFSLPNYYIVRRIGDRTVVMTGGILSCLSLIVASFSPSIVIWSISIGLGLGFAFSCVYFNTFSVVGRCFRRRLGLANGLSVAGVSVGQMAFPSLVTHLLTRYSLRNGTLVMAAVCLNICITAALMPRWIVDPEAELPPLVEGDVERIDLKRSFQSVNDETLSFEKNTPVKRSERRLATTLLVLYIGGKLFADNADVGVSFIAPSFGTQLGLSATMISSSIGIAGVFDLISRLIFGWLTDRPFCTGKRGLFMAFTWIFEGINAILFGELAFTSWNPYLSDYSIGRHKILPHASKVGYYICMSVHGVCSGTAMTQMVVVLSDWVGSERLASSLAIMMVILGLVYVPSQALTGYLNDITGSYVWSMRMCGFWLLVSALIFLLEFPIRNWFRRDIRLRLISRHDQLANVAVLRCDLNGTNHTGTPLPKICDRAVIHLSELSS